MLEARDELEQVGGLHREGVVIPQRVHADLVRPHQFLIQDEGNLPRRVVHHRERRHRTLLHLQLLLQHRAIREAEVRARRAEKLRQLLHVDLPVVRHGKEEEAGLLVLDEEILGEAALQRLHHLDALLDLHHRRMLQNIPRHFFGIKCGLAIGKCLLWISHSL